jgi:hypothetical protein
MDKVKEAKYWGIGSLSASLFFPTLAVIAGIVSLVKGRKNEDKSHKGFAIAGIVVGGINWLVRFSLGIVLFFAMIFGALSYSDLPVDHGKGHHNNNGTHSTVNPDCIPNVFEGNNEPDDMVNEEAVFVGCQVIGMDEKSAVDYITSKGFSYRVAERDGEGYPMTMDYRTDRINLFVRGGIVFDTTIG